MKVEAMDIVKELIGEHIPGLTIVDPNFTHANIVIYLLTGDTPR